MRRCGLGILLGALLCLSFPRLAQAQLVCNASATAIAFTPYSAGTATPDNITGNVQVTCQAVISLLVSYTITISAGGSGAVAARSMAGPATTRLSYQVYTTAALTQVWGDGTAGTAKVTDGYLLQLLGPVVRNYATFGSIPSGQIVPPGAYTDTLTVLVTY